MNYMYKRIIVLLKIYQSSFNVSCFQIFKYCNAVIFCLLLQSFSLHDTYLIPDDDIRKDFWNVPALAPQCSPISSLSCPDVVKDLNFRFNFKSSYGGLRDRNGIATGFTMVDKPSKPLVTPT